MYGTYRYYFFCETSYCVYRNVIIYIYYLLYVLNITLHIIISYTRKFGLTQTSFVGKMSPDIHISFTPTDTQLLTPFSSPM